MSFIDHYCHCLPSCKFTLFCMETISNGFSITVIAPIFCSQTNRPGSHTEPSATDTYAILLGNVSTTTRAPKNLPSPQPFHSLQCRRNHLVHVVILVLAQAATKDHLFFLVRQHLVGCIQRTVAFVVHRVVRLIPRLSLGTVLPADHRLRQNFYLIVSQSPKKNVSLPQNINAGFSRRYFLLKAFDLHLIFIPSSPRQYPAGHGTSDQQ